MRYRPLLAVAALIGMSQDALLAREPRQLEFKWSELDSRIAGRKVALLSVLRVTEYRVVGRLIGVLTPFAVAAAITPPLMSEFFEGPMVIIVPVIAAAGATGLSIAGYYIGKALDKRVTEIKIAREE